VTTPRKPRRRIGKRQAILVCGRIGREVYVWRELLGGRLEEALTGWTVPPIPLNMLTLPGRTHPARVRTLMEFLKKRFAAMPWARGAET
jgi:DNA-binding transcriptional LysR family regulator